MLEKLDGLCIMFAQANADPKKHKPKPRTPYRYPRPGLAAKRRKGSNPDQIRRFFRGR